MVLPISSCAYRRDYTVAIFNLTTVYIYKMYLITIGHKYQWVHTSINETLNFSCLHLSNERTTQLTVIYQYHISYHIRYNNKYKILYVFLSSYTYFASTILIYIPIWNEIGLGATWVEETLFNVLDLLDFYKIGYFFISPPNAPCNSGI